MGIVGITGGVDTHADVHVAAVIDHNGGLLGVESFPADQAGYADLLGWLVGFGEVEQIPSSNATTSGSSSICIPRSLTYQLDFSSVSNCSTMFRFQPLPGSGKNPAPIGGRFSEAKRIDSSALSRRQYSAKSSVSDTRTLAALVNSRVIRAPYRLTQPASVCVPYGRLIDQITGV